MEFYIDKIQLRNNVVQYTCWGELADSPLGILWVRFSVGESGKKIALLLNAMTIYYFKRKGVCSFLHKAVLNDADILLSASGSGEGGKEFLEKFGFIYNKDIDIWSIYK